MIQAITGELELRARNQKQRIETVYLGGGTPSLLELPLLEKLFKALNQFFEVDTEAEITLEANPDDITPENLNYWKHLGINRLSIGIQSFHDTDLKFLNRIHSVAKALECIELAQQYDFPNLTIDLIYGIPTLSNEQWLQNLDLFAKLHIPHLSAYALTVEPHTPLSLMIEKGKLQPVEEKQSSEQYEILMQFMERHGYLHYEISNFCLPDHFARHNVSYWKGIEYLGFGPSAHSFNGSIRQWNVSSVTEYMDAINQGNLPSESEILTIDNRYNEYVMTGLRTMWGCALSEIKDTFGASYESYFISQAQKWIAQSLMQQTGDHYTLTPKGKLFADGIASDIFMV